MVAANTRIVSVILLVPVALRADSVWFTASLTLSGGPDIKPVELLKLSPFARAGLSVQPESRPPVLLGAMQTGTGVVELMAEIEKHRNG